MSEVSFNPLDSCLEVSYTREQSSTNSASEEVNSFTKSRKMKVEVSTVFLSMCGLCKYHHVNGDKSHCFVIYQQNSTHIIYRNAILVSSTSTILGLVTRSNTYRVELECDVPRNASVNKYVQPLTETVTQKTLGQFVVTLTLYTVSGPCNHSDNGDS